MGQEELMNKIAELEREIAFLPEGSITKKKIKDKRITRLECRKIMNIQIFGTKSTIMKIRTGYDTKAGTSIAYINGVRRDEEFKEIGLMN